MRGFNVGDRVVQGHGQRFGVVVFNKETHSVRGYSGYVLVRVDPSFRCGWAAVPSHPLVPSGEDHLFGLENLLWIQPRELELEDLPVGYEMDA